MFHSREAAIGKARLPMVERRVCRTTSDDGKAERRRRQVLINAVNMQSDNNVSRLTAVKQ